VLYGLPQFTVDTMISTWCQDFYSKLNAQERDIIKKLILQRVHCIEKAEMNFLNPIRQLLHNSSIKNVYQIYQCYYSLLRLPDLLDALLAHGPSRSITQSDALFQAYTKLISFENYIQKPSISSLYSFLNQTEDYYIEKWYFLLECMQCT
jgi:hypothetical protein